MRTRHRLISKFEIAGVGAGMEPSNWEAAKKCSAREGVEARPPSSQLARDPPGGGGLETEACSDPA